MKPHTAPRNNISVDHACPFCGNTQNPVGELHKRYRITPQDAVLLNELVQGKPDKEIGKVLSVSTRAIKSRISRLALKLRIESAHPRVLLAKYWSWPLFRIGAGYESPNPTSAPSVSRKRLRS